MAAPSPAPSTRLRLDLDYDGAGFRGWAVQPGVRTVAGVLRDALAVVMRLSPGEFSLVVAGRTDAGVHADGQVCHVDVPAGMTVPLPRVERGLRGLLPPDIRLRHVRVAPPGFDARFAALRRHYRYRLDDDPAGVAPLRRGHVARHPRPLDIAVMNEASRSLLGLHDFAAFCRRRDAPTGMVSTIRTLERFAWSRNADGLVVADVSADAFCHSMVRALVGALVVVGDGRRPVQWPAQVLAAKVRNPAVVVAQPHGLSLTAVDYPDAAGLAVRAAQSRAVRSVDTGGAPD